MLLLPALALAGLQGCDNPADDVEAATVGEESPANSEESSSEEQNTEESEAEAPPLNTICFNNEASSVGFTGSKVAGSHDGGFREFTGSVSTVDGGVSNINVTIQTSSLFADDDQLTEHLKSDDFFDVEAHPTATFRADRIEPFAEGDATHSVSGELTLVGETQRIRFPATIELSGEESITASAEFSINRSDFGMSYSGMRDNLIRDEVVLRFNVTGQRALCN